MPDDLMGHARTIVKATSRLGRWSPGAPGRHRTQAELLRVAERIRAVAAHLFAEQRRWVATNWRMLATEGQQRRLLVKQEGGVPIFDWDDWMLPVVAELTPVLGRAMSLGGSTAQEELSLGVDWSLSSVEAQRFIREHGLELARGLNRVTRDAIRERIETGIRLGETGEHLRRGIQEVMRDLSVRRARLIAQTETIRAYAEGSLQVYREAGVPKKRWLNHRRNACAVCTGLHGETVGVDEPFSTGVQGPPQHPGCQCAIRAVVE